MAIPKYDDLFNPLLQSLHEFGGSSSIEEMDDKVGEILKLSDKDINEIHRGNRTKLGYRLAWARNYLKRYGLLENSSRGVWSLTLTGNKTKSVNKSEVNKVVKGFSLKSQDKIDEPSTQETLGWEEELLNLIKELSPSEFEKLCQRILREAGFTQVTVTGKSGDGGIDGRGVFKMGGLLSFHVIFQCKRYKGSVSSQQIREFKGTMSGRDDKGLFITTGTFTREAKQEASRDGSIQIDLVDGEELVNKMKELRLGVDVKMEEIVEIDKDWFKVF